MTTGTPPARDILLADIFNLRDLGGYQTADGRHLRWRRLFRGGGLHRLAAADLEVVRALGWRTVIDLRTPGELVRNGRYPRGMLPAEHYHLPLIREVWHPATLDPGVASEAYLLDRYREMLVEGASAIRTIIGLLAEPANLPAVFYCAAGKDRTGVVAALVLDALDVDGETIAADYHLSKERVERIRERAQARAEATTMTAQPEAFMQAPRAAMLGFIEWLHDTHGGAAGYLRSIDVTQDQLDQLSASLLEPATG